MNDTTPAPTYDEAAMLVAALHGLPDNGWGGHIFEYESNTDLFRCDYCQVYEATARHGRPAGAIAPCTGLPAYQFTTERAYLRATENRQVKSWMGTIVASGVRDSGWGRVPRFGWREGVWMVETVPALVGQLAAHAEQMTLPDPVRPETLSSARAFTTIERLTAEQGREVIAANYAAYVAEYGDPNTPGGNR